MKFRYFDAPESEMLGLLEGQHACDLCGRTGRCFDLSESLTPNKPPAGNRGCEYCLREGRFGFFRLTEVGYLDEGGLTWYGDPPTTRARVFVSSAGGIQENPRVPEPIAPPLPAEDSVAALRSTPIFSTWNEVPWPVHCQDFMVFRGSWQPADVVSAAVQEDVLPEVLFRSMVQPEDCALWRETGEWGVHFVVFQCITCRQYQGIIDLD